MKKLVKLAAILVVLALIVVALRRLAKEHLEVKVARKHERPAAPPSDAPDSMPETSPEPSLATADPKEVEPVEAEPVAVDQQAETEPKADEEEEPEPEPEPEAEPEPPALRIVETEEVDESAAEEMQEPAVVDDEDIPLAGEFKDVPQGPIRTAASRTADSYLDEGNVYFNVGQYDLAIERYSRAVELDDELVAAFYNRANAHTRAGEYEKAMADYNRTVELEPEDSDALNNRGMLNLYESRYEEALADFNDALEIQPDDATIIVNRGLAYLHGEHPSDAAADFKRAIELDAADPAASYGAAQSSAELGQRTEALQFLDAAFRLDPGYTEEAAGDPRLSSLTDDMDFLQLLREASEG